MTIKRIKKPTKTASFPKYMIGKTTRMVVYMLEETNNLGVGVCVLPGKLTTGKGLTLAGVLSKCWDMKYFSDYNEEVTLQNKLT